MLSSVRKDGMDVVSSIDFQRIPFDILQGVRFKAGKLKAQPDGIDENEGEEGK